MKPTSMLRPAAAALAGACMLAYSAIAMAQDGNSGVDWRTVALGFIGLLSTFFGVITMLTAAYVRGLEGRVAGKADSGIVDRIEKRVENQDRKTESQQRQLDDLHRELIASHPTKVDLDSAIAQGIKPLNTQIEHLTASVSAIHRRLDFLRVPTRPPPHMAQDDGA